MPPDHHSGRAGRSAFLAHQRLGVLHLGMLRSNLGSRDLIASSTRSATQLRRWLGRAYRLLFWAAIVGLGLHWSRNPGGEAASSLRASSPVPAMAQVFALGKR